MKIILNLVVLFMSMTSITIYAQETNEIKTRPDAHAPIGVMADHMHTKGEFMLSYRYMNMDMDGMRDGTDQIEPSTLTGTMMAPGEYQVSPVNMLMNMHMIGAMYAPSDQITLMAMVNVLDSDMDHVTRMGGSFSTSSSGFGDTKVAALFRILKEDNRNVHGKLGVNIPTGSIEEEGVTPASAPNATQLPYPMQLGSGTFDLEPSLTYNVSGEVISGGFQFGGNLRLGENDQDYRFGHQFFATPWVAAKAADWLSISGRLNYELAGEIQGSSPAYAMAALNNMVPTVIPENFGGSQLQASLGTNLFVPEGSLENLRLGLEYSLPVYRQSNGPMLETDGEFTVGLQYAF